MVATQGQSAADLAMPSGVARLVARCVSLIYAEFWLSQSHCDPYPTRLLNMKLLNSVFSKNKYGINDMNSSHADGKDNVK